MTEKHENKIGISLVKEIFHLTLILAEYLKDFYIKSLTHKSAKYNQRHRKLHCQKMSQFLLYSIQYDQRTFLLSKNFSPSSRRLCANVDNLCCSRLSPAFIWLLMSMLWHIIKEKRKPCSVEKCPPYHIIVTIFQDFL